jgi:uncharacterized membrane protein
VRRDGLDADLERWTAAGVLDAATAERVRAFESARGEPGRLGWPVLVAMSFGAALLASAVLLFVEANWDELAPSTRFALVLALTLGFHVAAAFASTRLDALGVALHAAGTAALGAGIFLAGQIFHLQEHWPGAFLLWALGAWLAYLLLRHWPQLAFAALLTPVWLVGEWVEASDLNATAQRIPAAGALLLALTYFTAPGREKPSAERRALLWLGAFATVPASFVLALMSRRADELALGAALLGWAVALLAPLVLAWRLHGRGAWTNALSALWVALVSLVVAQGDPGPLAGTALYLAFALGSLGMIAWGMHDGRGERVNLGMIGFALTLFAFYFANVFDKLGRAASLFGLGVVFIVVGLGLERARRRLVARIAEETR